VLSCRRRRVALLKSLHDSVPKHCVRPPFSARCILVSANHGAIDNRAGLIDINLKVAKNGSPMTLACPVREPVVHAFPESEALGQITPGKARLGPVQDGVDEQAIAADGVWSTSLGWNHSLQVSPLLVAERVAMHSCFSSRLAGGRKKARLFSRLAKVSTWLRSSSARGRPGALPTGRAQALRPSSAGCQPEPEEVMDAHSAAVDCRSRRGRPGASPQKPSAAFPYRAFSMRRTRDSP